MSTLNIILTSLVVVGLAFLMVYIFRKRSDEPDLDSVDYTLEAACEITLDEIQKETSSPVLLSFTEENKKRAQTRREMKRAIDRAPHGSLPDKIHVKTRVRQILENVYDLNSPEINNIIPFDQRGRLTVIDKFDIILYHYQYKLGKGLDAFSTIVDKYHLLKKKPIKYSYVLETDEEGQPTSYSDYGNIIYDNEIEMIFKKEFSEGLDLTYDDKANMITQRVYQNAFGLGVIDELIDQRIDGIRAGTGGIPASIAEGMDMEGMNGLAPKRSYNSIRLFFRGLSLHMDFLSFGSEQELSRIVNMIYLFAPVGQLNKYDAYKISERADNSRVVAVMPNMSDSPGFFVRKFDPSLRRLDSWFRKEDPKWEIIHDWLIWCARGGITSAFTGQQGSGKTTVMRAAVSYMYHKYNIRVQEGSAFELWLRISFHWKDIITFRETDRIAIDEAMSVQRKTDGTVNLIGEAADAKTVAAIIIAGSVASLYTWYSHHANSPKDLVGSHANALVNTKTITDTQGATEEVVSIIWQNFHLENVNGHRRFERVTQFHTVETKDYDLVDKSSPMAVLISLAENFRDYAGRRTDRKLYTHDNIFEYREGHGYVALNRPSDRILQKIRKNIEPEHREDFEKYLEETFKGVA